MIAGGGRGQGNQFEAKIYEHVPLYYNTIHFLDSKNSFNFFVACNVYVHSM